MNPRSLAPAAYEGLKLKCSEFGGFEAKVLESTVATTVALGTDWRPIREGTAIALMAETTAHAVCPDGIAVVPVQPPPHYVLALAWRHDEHAAAAHQLLEYMRRYRDQHAWITDAGVAPLTDDHGPSRPAAAIVAATRGSRDEIVRPWLQQWDAFIRPLHTGDAAQ